MFKCSSFLPIRFGSIQSTALYQAAVRCISTGIEKKPSLLQTQSQGSLTWVSSHRLHPPSTIQSRHMKIKSGPTRLITPHYRSDRVPEHFSVVYESSLKYYIYLLHGIIVVVGVSTVGLLAADGNQIFNNLFKEQLDGIVFSLTSVALMAGMGAMVYFARTVPIRIYHDQSSGGFIAVRRTLVGQLRQLNYFLSDVDSTASLKAEDISESTEVMIKGSKHYLRSEDFVAPEYYNMHIGGGNNSGPQF